MSTGRSDGSNLIDLIRRGGVLLDSGRLADAERVMRTLLDQRPPQPFAYYGLGQISMKRGQPDQAIQHFRQGLRVSPEGTPRALLHRVLGDAYRDKGRFTDAESEYRRAIAEDAVTGNPCAQLGLLLSLVGRYSEAEQYLKQALGLVLPRDEVTSGLHFALAVSLSHTGRSREAITELERSISLRPNESTFHFYLGHVLSSLGIREKATNAFRSAVTLMVPGPMLAPCQMALARSLLLSKSHDEAERDARSALENDPHNSLFQALLGDILRAAGRWSESEEIYQSTLAHSPDALMARIGLGRLYQAQRRYQEAEAEYRQVTTSHGKSSTALFYLGTVLYETGRFELALESIGSAIRYEPPGAGGIEEEDAPFPAFIETLKRLAQDSTPDDLLEAAYRANVLDIVVDSSLLDDVGNLFSRADARDEADPPRQCDRSERPNGLLQKWVWRVGFRSTRSPDLAARIAKLRLLASMRDQLLWISPSSETKTYWLQNFAGVGLRASELHLEMGELEHAVEHVERGRAVRLSMETGVKLPALTALSISGDTRLAAEYRAALLRRSHALLEPGDQAQRASRVRKERANLAQLTEEIRKHDPAFGKPFYWPDIKQTSEARPLVYLGLGPEKAFGIVVHRSRTWLVPGITDVQGLRTAASRMNDGEASQPSQDDLPTRYEASLGIIWSLLMSHVVAALKRQGLAKAILVPFGDLSHVPLHLAWHDQRDGRCFASEYIDFSFAPSAQVLAASRELLSIVSSPGSQSRSSASIFDRPGTYTGSVLAILDDRPDHGFPRQAEAAVTALKASFGGGLTVLRGQSASLSVVRSSLEGATIVYFIGHGRGPATTGPECGLYLPSGELLRLGDLDELLLKHRLWVVVACEGARPDGSIVEEAMSFSGGLIQSGVAGVVAAPCVVDAAHAVPVSLSMMARIARGTEPSEALRAAQIAHARSAGSGSSIWKPMLGIGDEVPARYRTSNPMLWGLQYFGS